MSRKVAYACNTPYCKNKITIRRLCRKCQCKKYRLDNPMQASYQTLRSNAKRRRKPFTISFEYFSKFAYETNYISGKGRSKLSYSVDCIIPHLGYVEGNLQILTLSANAKKGKKILHYDWETGSAYVVNAIGEGTVIDDIF